MRSNNHDLLIAWLRDAYAMEKGQISILESHARDATRHPELRTRLEQHARETRGQVATLEQCLAQLGEEPSGLKNVVARVMGAVQATATNLFKDEEVKNVLADHASEAFEVGCYLGLIEAARAVGENEIVGRCEQILREEQEMQRFLESQVPIVAREAVATVGSTT